MYLFALLLPAASEAARIPLSMLVVFVSAKLLAEIFERFRQPGIVGEILAGVIIGPLVLGWMVPNQILTVLAELGLMFLLFRVGLEIKSSDMMRVGGTGMLVAVAGVIVPFLLGGGHSGPLGRVANRSNLHGSGDGSDQRGNHCAGPGHQGAAGGPGEQGDPGSGRDR